MDAAIFLQALETLGVDFFTGVPDSLLAPLSDCLLAAHGLTGRHVVAANEGAAVGLAAGHTLATGRPAMVYLQNSGIGNAINPIVSLLDDHVYGIPCVFVVGWRGEPGVKDEPQHAFQGLITPALLTAVGLRVFELSRETSMEALAEMLETCRPLLAAGKSVAFLVHKGTFQGGHGAAGKSEAVLSREQALEALLRASGPRDIYVSTTGKTSREVFELREALGQDHAHDFLTVGSMGHAGMIALGIAKARPDFTVWCLDGDGAALMHLGSLAIEVQQHCLNMIHVLLNNGAHESVGGMPVAGGSLRFAALAKTLGYEAVFTAGSCEELTGLLPALRDAAKERLCFLELLLRQGSREDLGRPSQSPKENLQGLRETLS